MYVFFFFRFWRILSIFPFWSFFVFCFFFLKRYDSSFINRYSIRWIVLFCFVRIRVSIYFVFACRIDCCLWSKYGVSRGYWFVLFVWWQYIEVRTYCDLYFALTLWILVWLVLFYTMFPRGEDRCDNRMSLCSTYV